MTDTEIESPAAWRADDLDADQRWIFLVEDKARKHLADIVRKARDLGKTLFDYRRADFDLGPAWTVIDAALAETKRGRGSSREPCAAEYPATSTTSAAVSSITDRQLISV
jgi:hypothetical protein